ncbi:hypothetical protein EJ110_NYTH39386 [Nymphaea thermarum]|nr:hypothetical protein EJ110_NYTH39386 [Nymphaea thermarum]
MSSCKGLISLPETDPQVVKPVTISYDELRVPQLDVLRRNLLHLSVRLASLPEEVKEKLEDPDSRYNFGWSHGKEKVESGKLGLTCAMFMRGTQEVPCPDATAGLYIKTRMDQIVKVVFSDDELAYQIGEITEILSHGYLCATPHCVQAPKNDMAYDVSRATFALFMQPNWDEKLKFPSSLNLHRELIEPNDCLTFGEYSEKLLNKYNWEVQALTPYDKQQEPRDLQHRRANKTWAQSLMNPPKRRTRERYINFLSANVLLPNKYFKIYAAEPCEINAQYALSSSSNMCGDMSFHASNMISIPEKRLMKLDFRRGRRDSETALRWEAAAIWLVLKMACQQMGREETYRGVPRWKPTS